MLYIVATPIGNIEDISVRAKKILSEVDVLLCEDTRNTNRLLDLLDIKGKPRLESFYDEIEEQKIPKVTDWLREGKNIALVTDAGTPVISDPGWKLIKKCQKLEIKYTSVPGSCAVINALVLSGIPSGRFSFLGFLPKKTGERKKILERYKNVEGAKIVYESPFRINKLVEDIKVVYGEKVKIKICREMTKKFEEVSDVVKLEKGEMTVVFI